MQIRVYLKVMGLCDDLPWHMRIAVRLVGTRAEPKQALGQMQIRVYLKVIWVSAMTYPGIGGLLFSWSEPRRNPRKP